MRVSLNDLVSILASRAGQAWNTDLQEEMKVVLNYKRADFFKKLIEQHPDQRIFFLKDFSAELKLVDKAECPVDLDCEVLRTVHKVPRPIRSSYTLFDFVGTPDKSTAYAYAAPEMAEFYTKYNRYTGKSPKYFYVNGYIYVYNIDDLEYINVRGIFPDPRDLSDFKCENEPCYTDDDQYDLPDDLINSIIRDTLQIELRQQPPKEAEVDIDKSDKKTEQGGN